jgi:PadR family transcriptional regulator, regulatory protein PadR
LHILFHAAEEPICGVEIVAELARRGSRLNPGTVYPALHELTRADYLASRTQVVSGKRRRYYEATAKGRAALQAAKVKVRELAAEVLEEPDSQTRRPREKN